MDYSQKPTRSPSQRRSALGDRRDSHLARGFGCYRRNLDESPTTGNTEAVLQRLDTIESTHSPYRFGRQDVPKRNGNTENVSKWLDKMDFSHSSDTIGRPEVQVRNDTTMDWTSGTITFTRNAARDGSLASSRSSTTRRFGCGFETNSSRKTLPDSKLSPSVPARVDGREDTSHPNRQRECLTQYRPARRAVYRTSESPYEASDIDNRFGSCDGVRTHRPLRVRGGWPDRYQPPRENDSRPPYGTVRRNYPVNDRSNQQRSRGNRNGVNATERRYGPRSWNTPAPRAPATWKNLKNGGHLEQFMDEEGCYTEDEQEFSDDELESCVVHVSCTPPSYAEDQSEIIEPLKLFATLEEHNDDQIIDPSPQSDTTEELEFENTHTTDESPVLKSIFDNWLDENQDISPSNGSSKSTQIRLDTSTASTGSEANNNSINQPLVFSLLERVLDYQDVLLMIKQVDEGLFEEIQDYARRSGRIR